jgi:hypothetical protein
MVTYFVGVEEVTAYLRDFLDRLGYRALSATPVRLEEEQYILMEHALLHALPEAPPSPPNR